MTTPLQLAQHYFELSNRGDLTAIRALLTPSSTYSSANTGVYLGAAQIMTMQRAFFDSFTDLHWTVHRAEQINPGVIRFEFTLRGEKTDGEKVCRDGIEYIVVYQDKTQHVDVRNC